ncbi:MAG: ABC transporter ATP-binding protein [Pseudomonadota bacterium]|nr:ABC transporter ATP-binding protein [Pseudomonadota bacterium]
MIELMKIQKSYFLAGKEEPVLKGVDLKITDGEMVALMGPSGSGKSTLMNIIGLLDHPTQGQYFLNKKEIATMNADDRAELRNRYIGFVFQQFFLLPRQTALQNVGLPLIYRNLLPQEIKETAMEKLKRVGMDSLSHHRPSELSGGQQQRVAIARALVGDPKVILADEPTGALDSSTGQDVMNLLKELNRDGTTIIIITHDQEVADQCNRCYRLRDGRIVD